MKTDIEQQILDALARNTTMLQRRAERAARLARDAMEEYQRQIVLIGHTRRVTTNGDL